MKNVINIMVTSAVSFAMLGLDEISHLLEQPFQLMPLQELSKRMMMDVGDAFVFQPPCLTNEVAEVEETRRLPSYW